MSGIFKDEQKDKGIIIYNQKSFFKDFFRTLFPLLNIY